MKTSVNNKRGGFTLIEMVGVLAVIAILAALLIPKIFAAINESRLNNTIASVNTVKTAAMSYFGKYGKFGNVNGRAFTQAELGGSLATTNWDSVVLLPEGLIERPFAPKVSDDVAVQVVAPVTGTNAPTATDAAYSLSTVSSGNDAAGGAVVVQIVLRGVAADDAYQISKRIDGDTMSEADATTSDIRGRVKYSTPANGVTDVRVYLANK